jgi:hypothetical protein
MRIFMFGPNDGDGGGPSIPPGRCALNGPSDVDGDCDGDCGAGGSACDGDCSG